MNEPENKLPPLKFLYGTGEPQPFRVVYPLYGGDFLTEDCSIRLPFVLRKELIEPTPDGKYRVVEPAIERVQPVCPHFTVCGGCQYQMIAPYEQLNVKRRILQSLLAEHGIERDHFIAAHAGEPYRYRNRIRLRILSVEGELRLGYNIRTTSDFLPITECPIAAPVLFQTAESLLALGATNRDAAHWLNAAHEVELFTNHNFSQLQLTLFVNPRTKAPQGSFHRVMTALQQETPSLTGAEAQAFDPRMGPTGRKLDTFDQSGLNYRVDFSENDAETYWITRGGFFQVNRFLIPELVKLVTESDGQPRSGKLAWDLFAGVGLFSRILARSFEQVTAVEANPMAAKDLRVALSKQSKQHQAIEATTLAFLQQAVTQRDRPELVVLDPPRAGAGTEACELLNRLAAQEIVYVSCDPTTLARDLAVLQSHYKITALHLVDLFPQTSHLETVALLNRIS